MTLSKNAETGISLAIPEISEEKSLLIQVIPTYPDLYRVTSIPQSDIPRYPITRILSLHIPKQLEKSGLIPGYPQAGISHMSDSGYPGIACRDSGQV